MASRPKKAEMAPDAVRNEILDFLHTRHRNARGVKAQEIGIRDLQQALKSSLGLTQREVASNLDYLVQKGWVRDVRTPRSYTTSFGTTQSSEQTTYKISDVGIDMIEGESQFRSVRPYGGINVENVEGVVVIGDHNVVKSEFLHISRELELLRREVIQSPLQDDSKIATIADIETIQDQLSKAGPNGSIIREAWSGIERLATIGGFSGLVLKIGSLLAPLVQ